MTQTFPHQNLYHCCTHKSASQWFRFLFDDPLITRWTGMRTHHYLSLMTPQRDPRPYTERFFDAPFPERTVVVCLYMAYPCFKAMPKPASYRGFFLMRDPRDIVVSWYYSLKYSHPLERKKEHDHRSALHELSLDDGLKYTIRALNKPKGLFAGLRSWAEGLVDDGAMRVFRFERIFGPEHTRAVRELMDHLEVAISDGDLGALLDKYAFNRLSGGRTPGMVDERHHYRKGQPNGWRDEFTADVEHYFHEQTGGLLEELGYSPAR